MTNEEAEKVLDIMKTADGYCSDCAWGLFTSFVEGWGEHEELAKEIYKEEFDTEL